MTHFLEQGGEHVEPQRFRIMMACGEMCRTSAYFMLINSPQHKRMCRECAEICELCAHNCALIGDMRQSKRLPIAAASYNKRTTQI